MLKPWNNTDILNKCKDRDKFLKEILKENEASKIDRVKQLFI